MVHEELPAIAVLEVLEGGGPYEAGELLSLASTSARTGRLLAHKAHQPQWTPGAAMIPEFVNVRVLGASGAFSNGDILGLSFVDPSAVRIHGNYGCVASPLVRLEPNDTSIPTCAGMLDGDRSSSCRSLEPGVRVRAAWDSTRVRRFAQLIDRLFSVERLGWYRHTLTMRLLLPDRIVCANAGVSAEATRRLASLRSATAATLGAPLLAAFMPNFTVTPDWLQSFEDLATAKAVAALVEIIAPEVEGVCDENSAMIEETSGVINACEFHRAPAASVDALLPLLMPSSSKCTALSETLASYRRDLLELFAQAATSGEPVRFKQMSQPIPLLDDRLRALSEALRKSLATPSLASAGADLVPS